jgi:hypothetical protein
MLTVTTIELSVRHASYFGFSKLQKPATSGITETGEYRLASWLKPIDIETPQNQGLCESITILQV